MVLSWKTFGISRLYQITVARNQNVFIPKRWKRNIKKKYTVRGIYNKTDPIILALRHFDETYAAHFGKQWPIIRLGLLSPHKYGALVNNFTSAMDAESTHIRRLKTFGAVDLVERAAEKQHHQGRNLVTDEEMLQEINNESHHLPQQHETHHNSPTMINDNVISTRERMEPSLINTSEKVEQENQSEAAADDDQTAAAVEQQEWWQEQFIISPGYEGKMTEFLRQDGDGGMTNQLGGPASDIKIINEPINISEHLKYFVHEDEGNVKPFPRMRGDPSTRLLTYYPMDAASILPVLALDLKPEESVLDLCAAPGGKSLAMLQTMCVDGLRANEPSKSRRLRLKSVIQSYVPRAVVESGAISFTQEDGCEMGEMEPKTYDKVLVDVPCTTDRRSVMDQTDNIFTPFRTAERRDLPKLQRRLLCSAIQAVKPGGDVVYSTCTLSQLQNDDVIETAIYTCRSQYKIKVAVVDLSPLTSAVSDVFNVWGRCSYGQLVLPGIRRNCGPMYFCKLRRLK